MEPFDRGDGALSGLLWYGLARVRRTQAYPCVVPQNPQNNMGEPIVVGKTHTSNFTTAALSVVVQCGGVGWSPGPSCAKPPGGSEDSAGCPA